MRSLAFRRPRIGNEVVCRDPQKLLRGVAGEHHPVEANGQTAKNAAAAFHPGIIKRASRKSDEELRSAPTLGKEKNPPYFFVRRVGEGHYAFRLADLGGEVGRHSSAGADSASRRGCACVCKEKANRKNKSRFSRMD